MNVEKFLSKVVKSNGCWFWTGAVSTHGYGNVWFNGAWTSAHRLSWELRNGAVPDGLFVLHRCDVRNCVRPSHLFLGTQRDNLDDMTVKGRRIHGDTHPNSKLTSEDVIRLREMRTRGVRLKDIAKVFGVSRQTAGDVARGLLYRHVP